MAFSDGIVYHKTQMISMVNSIMPKENTRLIHIDTREISCSAIHRSAYNEHTYRKECYIQTVISSSNLEHSRPFKYGFTSTEKNSSSSRLWNCEEASSLDHVQWLLLASCRLSGVTPDILALGKLAVCSFPVTITLLRPWAIPSNPCTSFWYVDCI